ncbi:MAG: hypothetical protein LC808_39055 [Actinobacteria bacterium]|nr:hypothetical protein [Actinomycetota bacterium]
MLKSLLRQKHWQTYRTFCLQYDKAARTIDSSLVGSYPSRAQLHRWQSGDLKGLPYSHHCQVLEVMFPGITATQMFMPVEDDGEPGAPSSTGPLTESVLLDSIKAGLDAPDAPRPGWRREGLATGSKPPGPQLSFPLVGGPTPAGEGTGADVGTRIARSVVMLSKSMALPDVETAELGKLAGNLVDLQMDCSIDIAADGWASVTYCHRVMNLSSRPIKRMTREQWFETTSGPLKIEPHSSSDRNVYILRIHDTPNMSKFACQFSPAIEPGEVATISYTSQGGRFVHDHYWRQSIPRYTRYFTLNIRHRDAPMLLNCTAIEEQIDGSETSAIEDLICSDEDGDALVTLTREFLQPGQAVTVRWEVNHATARPS